MPQNTTRPVSSSTRPRRPRTAVLALASALLLGACAPLPRVPEASTPAPLGGVPAQWHASRTDDQPPGADTAVASWAGDLGDPVLTALVRDALAANVDLQTAQAAVRRARALSALTLASQAVQVGSSASVGRSRSNGQTGNSLRAGLDASWEPDLFGTQSAARQAALATVDARTASWRATQLAVAAETAVTYVSWQGLRRQIEVAQASLDSQVETDRLVRARVEVGIASLLEQAQSTATLEQTRARLPQLQHGLAQAEHALSVLLGQAPAALSERLARAPHAMPQVPALPALPVPLEVLRRRPDVQAAERDATAALATLQQREAERRPSFTLSGSIALQAATASALTGPGALVAGLAASLNWPLLDGGAGAAQVDAQQAAVDSARLAWRGAVLAALQDVEDSLSARSQLQLRADRLARASAAADQALVLARERWASGLIDYASVLDSQRGALSAGDALASARSDLVASHLRLLKALGGGIGLPPETAADRTAPGSASPSASSSASPSASASASATPAAAAQQPPSPTTPAARTAPSA
jgi:outer membrane protein, multidrug efflux system